MQDENRSGEPARRNISPISEAGKKMISGPLAQ